ncbi:MAG: BamA/TamA family outer membrane protein, partial [Bacteroidetes bacterium]|nr:BamA/TamA family outer membrane protein [Bacteroidota bacterium]
MREPVVWDIQFTGNETFADLVLKNSIATKEPSFFQKLIGRHGDFILNERELMRDQIRLKRFYERRGFHLVEIDYTVNEEHKKEWKRTICFSIREAVPLRIDTSRVEIDAPSGIVEKIRESSDFNRTLNRHEFRQGKRYEPIRRPDVEGAFLEVLENMGFAWPDIEIDATIDSLASEVAVLIRLMPENRTYFSDFEIEGDLSVSRQILLRQTGIDRGEMFTQRKIEDAQRSIFNHHLFRFATITLPEQPHDTTLTSLIRIRENEPRTIQLSGGVSAEEIVRGEVSWTHRNISGTGHRLSTGARASFIEQRASADYLFPYLFNWKSSSITSLFGLHRLEPAFELYQVGVNSSLIYQARRNKTFSISYEYSLNEEFVRDERVDLPESVLAYDVSSIKLSGYSRQRRGWVLRPSAEFSGTFGEASFKFQKFNLDIRKYTPITGSLTFAKRLNAGVIFFTQPDSLPSNIRYYAGGTNTVRGWNRQQLGPKVAGFDEEGNFDSYIPVGGRTLLTFNAELRQSLDRF